MKQRWLFWVAMVPAIWAGTAHADRQRLETKLELVARGMPPKLVSALREEDICSQLTDYARAATEARLVGVSKSKLAQIGRMPDKFSRALQSVALDYAFDYPQQPNNTAMDTARACARTAFNIP